MKICFGMRSTRDVVMRHGVLTAGATWATDRLGFQASRSNIPIDFYADCRAAYISPYLRSGDYADWSPGFPMSKMKGNMCNFVLVWVFLIVGSYL